MYGSLALVDFDLPSLDIDQSPYSNTSIDIDAKKQRLAKSGPAHRKTVSQNSYDLVYFQAFATD
jgi:hypothetical protein